VRTGSFKRFTAATHDLLAEVTKDENFYTCHEMKKFYLALRNTHPVMTLVWCQYLAHADCVDLGVWASFAGECGTTGILLFLLSCRLSIVV